MFKIDGPLSRVMNRLVDLAVLNLFVLITCFPVITAGAAFTAMHAVLLKMVRDEEGSVTHQYFTYFKQNFIQATVLWCGVLVLGGSAVLDFRILGSGELRLPKILTFILAGACVLIFLVLLYVFPLTARFVNSTRKMLNNAVILVFAALPRTAAMAFICALFTGIFISVPRAVPVFLVFGITAPAYLCALVYEPLIRRLEENVEKQQDPVEPDRESL